VTEQLTVEHYEPALRAEWDDVVRTARARHFMFERDFMDYHADRFTDASIIVRRSGRAIAVLPASRHDDEVVSHGGLTFGGLLSGPELTAQRAERVFEMVTSLLADEGVRRLVYKPMPHIYHLAPAEEDLYALHSAGARLIRREVTTALRANTSVPQSQERRRAIRLGRTSGAQFEESSPIEDFVELLAEMLRERHGLQPVHTAAELRLLITRFPQTIRLFVATEETVLVAGVLIFETPAVAHAQYIASGPRGRELGATDALVAHLVEHVYADRWFDLGVSNERNGALNAGLQRFKEGFGARTIVHDQYALDLSP
jgi:Acetyltransferase (GNAT) domain